MRPGFPMQRACTQALSGKWTVGLNHPSKYILTKGSESRASCWLSERATPAHHALRLPAGKQKATLPELYDTSNAAKRSQPLRGC